MSNGSTSLSTPLTEGSAAAKYKVIPVTVVNSEEEGGRGGGGGAKDEDSREQWGNSLQFFFTVLGFCVGLGNIWRFPYLCQANGGGAFVIPFLIMILVEGMPLMLLEFGVGQKFRRGSYVVWNRIHPWIGGIGLGSTVIAVVVGCYYNVIIAWCLYYLAISIRPTLPWSDCPLEEGSNTTNVAECAKSSETQYFWYREALDLTGSIDDLGGVRWWMLLSLVASWAVVYFIIMKGIQSSGKVVYFTALFPYVVLTIFFVRGLTLKGASDGIAHMFYPDMNKLRDPRVWLDAANQVFYSFGIAFGSIVSFGSYNPSKKNCVLDAYVISACNAFTAVYACAVVFAILGFKAHHLYDQCLESDVSLMSNWTCDAYLAAGSPDASEITSDQYVALTHSCAEEVAPTSSWPFQNCSLEAELNEAAQGTGLAFIVMADVFTMLPGAPFWSFLFFAMLLSLGLGSQIGILEGVLGTLFDMPQLNKRFSKPVLSGAGCFLCFLIGTLFTTGAGEYWLTLFDKYGAMGLTLIALAELVGVSYVYGHRRFSDDIREMTGDRPGLYWQVMWRLLAPVLIAIILVWSVVSELMKNPTYWAWSKEEAKTVETTYPTWCLVVAFFLAIASVVPMVALGGLRMCGLSVLSVDEQEGAAAKREEEEEDQGEKAGKLLHGEGLKC